MWPRHGLHRKHRFQHLLHCCVHALFSDGPGIVASLQSRCLEMTVFLALILSVRPNVTICLDMSFKCSDKVHNATLNFVDMSNCWVQSCHIHVTSCVIRFIWCRYNCTWQSNNSPPRNQHKLFFVRFEVFTAVTMKNAVFWDVAPCRSCVNRRFGERIASIFRVEKSASEEPAWADCSHLLTLVIRVPVAYSGGATPRQRHFLVPFGV
jgi:hypothetical protein